jgi:hypothetical protein
MTLDLLNDRHRVSINLSVREAHYPIALSPKPFGTFEVPKNHFVEAFMNSAVNLDHQSARVAGEISHIGSDRRLPSDMRIELAKLPP